MKSTYPLKIHNDENWRTLSGFFPDTWRHKAFELGAIKRLRGFPSVDILLRMLLIHLGEGVSLKQTCNIANQAGWADVSDVTLLNRLRQSSDWFRWLARELVSNHHPARIDLTCPEWLADYRVKSIDATVVSEPGSTGTDWRLHYCIELFELLCQQFVLTGPEQGETVTNFQFKPGDLVVGDRAYCSKSAITTLTAQGVDWLFRYKHKSVHLLTTDANTEAADLFGWLGSLKEGFVSELPVCIKGGSGEEVRLIGIRKNEQAAQHARKKYRAKMSRRQAVIHKETEQLQDYILVLTSLTDPAIQAAQVLELYRLRWQIEIAFKRLKSLIGLGHLPKYDPQSCRAWLHGKLFIALLVDLLVEEARLFSPWGYPLQDGYRQSPLSMERG